ncbi:helix-turn-helix domain-containing protein [Corynebacterium sp. YSMAA1_1_F7]|uniref:helix-turn-helix domain-containing protein n=1 Tax=Corynebacterium sp. YSMAA1_1_F7 TaxID=3383590 RepID=UPI0038D1735F
MTEQQDSQAIITGVWFTAFKKAGMVDPRTGEPSLQALSRETGVHPSSLSRIVTGRTKAPRLATVQAIAKALNTDVITVAGWIGMTWASAPEVWEPPEEAALMNTRQREIVEELIRQLVKPAQ